jgi:hypothetical protein
LRLTPLFVGCGTSLSIMKHKKKWSFHISCWTCI